MVAWVPAPPIDKESEDTIVDGPFIMCSGEEGTMTVWDIRDIHTPVVHTLSHSGGSREVCLSGICVNHRFAIIGTQSKGLTTVNMLTEKRVNAFTEDQLIQAVKNPNCNLVRFVHGINSILC